MTLSQNNQSNMEHLSQLISLLLIILYYSGRSDGNKKGPYSEEDGLFGMVTEKKSFTDKTELLRLIPQRGLFQFIQAPSRFGKSTILNMIKSFFEITVDKSGERILRKSKTPNYQLFAQIPPHLGRHLNIFQDVNFMDTHFGEYPVVHLNFKLINPIPFTEENLATYVELVIMTAFEDHFYLAKSEKCAYKDTLKRYFIDRLEPPKKMSHVIDRMGMFLRSLKEHHGRPVLVLVDEFDSPIGRILMSEADIDIESFAENFGSFVSYLFKDNPLVPYAYMTGITRYGEIYSWGATNIQHRSVFLNWEYSPFFGLNEAEVKDLCVRYGRPEFYAELEEWFDGYCATDCKWKIFNTISVVDSLEANKITHSWIKSGFVESVDRIFRFENLGQCVWQSLQNHSLWLNVAEQLSASKVKKLKTVIKSGNVVVDNKDLALQFLFENGFFALSGPKKISPSGSQVTDICIPNKEIKESLSNRLYTAAKLKYKNLEMTLQGFYNALMQVQPDEKSSLQKFVNAIATLMRVYPRKVRNEPEFQAILYASTISFLQRAYLQVKVGYFGPAKRNSQERILKIQKHGEPGITDFVFLRENPYPTDNLTYTLFKLELKFGDREKWFAAITQCVKTDIKRYFIKCKNKRVGDCEVTHYYYVGLHSNEKKEVTVVVIYDDNKIVNVTFVHV